MKNTNFLKEMSWTTFDERRKTTDLAIIPSGAFEVYGPHLPLGSDTLVAEKLAELVAERVNAIIGPTLEVGDSASLDAFPGTITIKPESFKDYMWDTVQSLKKWGFKRFFFVNTHVNNVPMITQIVNDLHRDEEIRCAQIDYWRFVQHHSEGITVSGPLAHGHASETGTSVMLHLYPELVDVDKMVNEPPQVDNHYPDILTHIPFNSYSKSGTMGDATLGTKEKGEKLVQRSVDRIVEFIENDFLVNDRFGSPR